MTEADEVAAAMLPDYLAYKASLIPPFRGHSKTSVNQWVMDQLRATESYTVIDAVQAALVELVFPNGNESPYQPWKNQNANI